MTLTQVLAGGTATLALAAALLALNRSRSEPTRSTLRDHADRLARLEAARAAPRAPDPSGAALRDELTRISERLESLAASARREPAEPTAAPSAPVEAVAPVERKPPADADQRREFEALLALFGPDYDFRGTPQEMQRFFALARDAGLLDQSISEFEARVDANGGDLQARMELAELYVAKLMTLPHGPEQGLWGERAEAQWRAVSERDPEHWEAHFALGNNFAYYPDVLGKTKDAIRYLEQSRRIQENAAPRDEEVRVYLALSRLYARQADTERERAVLESGLLRHPGNAEIQEALEDLDE